MPLTSLAKVSFPKTIAGLLGETLFNANGTFNGEDRFQPFYAPGAPRAGWVGVRWEFGGASQ